MKKVRFCLLVTEGDMPAQAKINCTNSLLFIPLTPSKLYLIALMNHNSLFGCRLCFLISYRFFDGCLDAPTYYPNTRLKKLERMNEMLDHIEERKKKNMTPKSELKKEILSLGVKTFGRVRKIHLIHSN